ARAAQQNPEHSFGHSGSYLARLTVQDMAGARASKVLPLSAATAGDFGLNALGLVGANELTAPAVVSFAGSAQGGVQPYTFAWDFGDGTPGSAEQGPAHLYSYEGTYVAKLTVTDAQS